MKIKTNGKLSSFRGSENLTLLFKAAIPLNVRAKTIKLLCWQKSCFFFFPMTSYRRNQTNILANPILEENRRLSHDLGFSKSILGWANQSPSNVHIIKIKNVYGSQDTTKNLKRQPTQWEKILANPLFDKVLISRI